MKLTTENVETVLVDCLFKDGEDTSKAVIGVGVVNHFGFHPERLEFHRQDIKEMLECLPDEFRADKGGGWSFLNGCMTREGEQWGEQMAVDKLMILGLATKQVSFMLPREMWNILPGSVPYFATFPAQHQPEA